MNRFRTLLRGLLLTLTLFVSYGLPASMAIASSTYVHGKVVNHNNGAPLHHAEFWLYLDDQFINSGETADDGQYALQVNWSPKPDSTARIVVNAPGFTPESRSFDPSQGDVSVDFSLHHSAALSGTVRDAATAAPVEDALVRLLARAEGSSSWTLREIVATDSNGRYNVRETPADTYKVCAEGLRNGLVRQCFDGIDVETSASIDAATPVILAEGANRGDVDFSLRRGGTIAGKLIDADSGTPIADIEVGMTLYDVNGVQLDIGAVRTDAVGAYRLHGVPNGVFHLTARVTHGFSSTQLYPGIDCPNGTCPPATIGQTLTIRNDSTIEGVDFSFKPSVTVRGVVTDADGRPLSEISVGACREGNTPICTYFSRTGIDGRYALHVNGGWTYTLVAFADEGHANQMYPNAVCDYWCGDAYRHNGARFAVNTGDRIDGIDFSLPPSARLSGTLRDTTGAPVRGQITAYDADGREVWNVHTDMNGSYNGQKWTAGTYYLLGTAYTWHGACAVYRERPCPRSASVLSVDPTPLVLAPGEQRTDIEIRVPSERIFADSFEATPAQ